MRLKLVLKQNKSNQLIPINYQYAISSFIYRTIETADNKYSAWLHRSGFMSGSKKFKLFTFSKLNIREVTNQNLYGMTYMNIGSSEMELIVSMLSEKTVENFIIGMFEKQSFKYYDNNIESKFDIKSVEMVPEPEFKEEMIFKTISPIVLSRRTIHNSKESQEYLSPVIEEYPEYLGKNLEEKFLAVMQRKGDTVSTNTDFSSFTKSSLRSFQIIGESKSKLITIKEETPEESKVKGYYCTFRIKSDPRKLKIGYEAGFGKNCSLGFGCVSVISNKQFVN